MVKLSDWHSLPESAKEAALEWHVCLTAPDAGDDVYAAFADWIAADADNAAAMACVEAFDDRLQFLRPAKVVTAASQGAATRELPKRRWLQDPHLKFAALAASLAVMVVAAVVWMSAFTPFHPYQVIVASADHLENAELSDGTNVTLAPGARMLVSFDRSERRVKEFDGVGYFHVAHDTSRPFRIAFGGGEITVVGTQFEVRSFGSERAVSVRDGVVSVSLPQDSDAKRLTAGQSLSVSGPETASIIGEVDAEKVGEWRGGALEFSNAPMSAVVRTLNKLYGGHTFAIADPGVSEKEFSGVLQVSDANSVARRMNEIMAVRVVEDAGQFLVYSQTDVNE